MVPYLRAANVKDGRLDLSDVKEMDFTLMEQATFALRPGDVLVTEGAGSLAAVGASAVWSGEIDGTVCFQNTLLRLRPAGGTDPGFLMWWARHAYGSGLFAAAAGGANIFHLGAETVRTLPTSVPSLPRQRAIADYLDAETDRIDRTMAKWRDLHTLLQSRWQVRLSSLIFDRLRSVAFAEDATLGSVPNGWRRMRLRHCVEITVGVVVNPSSYFVDDGVPFLHGSDIRDGWIDTSNLKYLSAESNVALSKTRLSAGDVVVVRAGYPGRAAVVPAELDGANCASILILRQGEALRPAYLAHFMNSREGRRQVALAQYGAAQEQVNVSDIVDFVAPVPTLHEQDRIVAEVALEEARHLELVGRANRQIALLLERRHALVTAAVTGQIDIPGVAA